MIGIGRDHHTVDLRRAEYPSDKHFQGPTRSVILSGGASPATEGPAFRPLGKLVAQLDPSPGLRAGQGLVEERHAEGEDVDHGLCQQRDYAGPVTLAGHRNSRPSLNNKDEESHCMARASTSSSGSFRSGDFVGHYPGYSAPTADALYAPAVRIVRSRATPRPAGRAIGGAEGISSGTGPATARLHRGAQSSLGTQELPQERPIRGVEGDVADQLVFPDRRNLCRASTSWLASARIAIWPHLRHWSHSFSSTSHQLHRGQGAPPLFLDEYYRAPVRAITTSRGKSAGTSQPSE